MPMPLQPPAIEDSVVTARYPFLPQANAAIKTHMEANNIDLEALVDTEWLEEVRIRARVRLAQSVTMKDGIDATTTFDIIGKLRARRLQWLGHMLRAGGGCPCQQGQADPSI